MEKLMKITNKIFLPFICIVVFIILLKLNINTHIFHDEFVYSVIYGTQEKIQTIKDVFISVKNLYITHNGRVVTHLILMLFLMTPKIFRDIINSIFFVSLILELIIFSRKKSGNIKDFLINLMIFPLLWCTIPVFGETVIWFSGSINYLLSVDLLLLYIYIIYNIWKKEEKLKTCKLVMISIFSFLIGTLHETIGIIAISYIGMTFLYLLIKNKKVNLDLLLSGIFSILGFCIIIFSPGTNVRKLAELQTMQSVPSYFERLQRTFSMLYQTFFHMPIVLIVLLGFVIYFIVQFIKNKKTTLQNKEMLSNIFLLISATLTYFAMIASPTFLERVTFCGYIIYIFIFLKILYLDIKIEKLEILKQILIIALILILGKNTYTTLAETLELTKKLSVQEGRENVYVKPLGCEYNSYMYGEDISTFIAAPKNCSMAAYYELKSIRILSNYYFDIEISNVNEKNTDSIIVKTNVYEGKQLFYILDKEIYQKQAPFKRYRNAYKTGDITLYFSMPEIENLSIQFTKSQELTIKSIKIYTPENTLLELYGEDILNYIKLENIEIENKNENEIILKVDENGKINLLKGEN